MAVLNLGKPTFANGSSSWTPTYSSYNGGTFALTGSSYNTDTGVLTVTLTYNRSGYNSQGVYASLNNDRTSMGNSSNYTSVATGWGTSIGTGEYYALRKTSSTTVTISSGNTSNISMLKKDGGGSSGTGVTGITLTVSSKVSTSAILNGTVPIYLQAIYSSAWKAINSARWIGTEGGYSKKNNTTLKFPNNTNKFEYTVSYNANGGSGAPSSQTKQSGTALTITSTVPTRSTENTTDGYKITLNPNGGSCNTASMVSTIRRSWTFDCWDSCKYTSYDLLMVQRYVLGEKEFFTPTEMDLYDTDNNNIIDATDRTNIQQTMINDSVNIAVNAGGSLSEEITSNITLYAIYTPADTQNAVALPTPSREGYRFKGWAETANATSGVIGNYTPVDDVTLYAIWEKADFLLSYRDSSGNFTHGGVIKAKDSNGNWIEIHRIYIKDGNGKFQLH